MNSKRNKIALYVIVIILSLIITYLRVENEKLKDKLSILSQNIEAKNNYDSKIIGIGIKELKLYSLNDGRDIYPDIDNGIIMYSNNKGCRKCENHVDAILEKYVIKKKFYVYICSHSISEFNPIRDKILKYKNINWDKYNSLSLATGVDFSKTLPLLLFVKKGVVINYCFINDQNISQIEKIFEKISG